MTSAMPSGHASFIGRHRELHRLAQAWERARTGDATFALVEAEAGMGKTRLAMEFTSRAVRGGARVLWGECIELQEGGLPYAPFRQALRYVDNDPGLRAAMDDAGRELAALLTGPVEQLATGHIRSRRTGLFEALLRLLHDLARTRPVLLVVEDVHWADHTTLDLLTFLSRNLGAIPLLSVLTYRPRLAQRSRALQDLLFGQSTGVIADRVVLPAFDEREVAEQIAELMAEPPRASFVADVVHRSGGNPLYVEELVASARTGSEELSPTLRQLLQHRVQALPADVRDVLEVAAVAGHTVPYDLLRAVVDVPRDELRQLLRRAVDAEVLVEDRASARYTFRHALVQEALYDDLSLDRRRELHRRFADVLLARQPHQLAAPGAIARHWDEAGEPQRALRAYLSAATAARATFGFVDAERFLRRVYELWDDVGSAEALAGMSWRRLANKTVEAALAIDECDTAITIARAVLARTEAERDEAAMAFQRALLAQALWYAGEEAEAMEASRVATDASAQLSPSPAQARVFALRSGLLALNGRYAAAGSTAQRALDVAMDVGAPKAYRYALVTLGSVRARQGALDEGLALLDDAEELARLRNDADEVMRTVLHRGRALQAYAQWERARQNYVDGLTAAPKYGMHPRYSWRFHVLAARMLFLQGRWDDSEAELAQARELVPGRSAALPSLLVATGHFDQAAALLTEQRSNWRSDGTGLLQVPEAPVELAVWQRRYDEARERADRGLALVHGSEERIPEARLCLAALRAEAERAESAPDRGSADRRVAADRAAHLLDRLVALRAERPARPDGFGQEIAALAATGEAEHRRVAGGPDPDAWASAVTHWEALAMPYPAAYARWQQARALRAHGSDRRRAGELQAAALATAEQIGARPLVDAIRGVAPRPVRTDDDATPTADLTPREQEVVDLLVRGHTNREIADALVIAEGTASVHVSNILRKLGVGSRTQAIALLLGRRDDVAE